MHMYFRRLGTSEHLAVTAEDRTEASDRPRTFLTSTKTFRGLQEVLAAAEKAQINDQGLADLHRFVQSTSKFAEASSNALSISSEELEKLGFPPMKQATRSFLVSIHVDPAGGDRMLVKARLRDVPPGLRTPERERVFSKAELQEALTVIDRSVADLHDARLGPDVPQKARFDAEDVNTLWSWNSLGKF